jgi:hypothetical protein
MPDVGKGFADTVKRPMQAAGVLAALLLIAGCGTTKMSGTARTATEQLLLTNAWDDALRKVDFRPLAGVPVYLDPQYLESPVDKGWLTSSVRQAMLAHGVLLRTKPEQAQWIVEARVGVYGTNNYDWLLGVPQMTIPVSITGLPTGTIPEIPMAKKSNQQGVAKLALYAYDRASGQVTWNSGTMLAVSDAQDVYIGGVGPIQSGSIRQGTEFIGVRVPSIIEEEPTSESVLPPASDVPFHAPTLSLPTSAADAESFAP